MIKLVGHRLLYLLPVLFGVALLTFLIASLLPGDLAYVLLGDQATPETLAALQHDLGLDRPIVLRFAHWLGHVLQGDLGRSFRTGQTVVAAIAERLPVSIELMLLAEAGALAVAIPLAIVSAVVASHGGTIVLEHPVPGPPRSGTRFVIQIPLDAPELENDQASRGTGAGASSPGAGASPSGTDGESSPVAAPARHLTRRARNGRSTSA